MKTLFESERIRFVRVSKRLAEDYLAMMNDAEHVGRFIRRRDAAFTMKDELRWVRKKQREKAPLFSMLEKDSGAFIGNIELMHIHDGEGELGIAITAKKQELGYGTEGIEAVLHYGMYVLGLNRIFLKVYPDNARAIRVYEKCGFREYDRAEDLVYMEVKKQQ